MSAPDPDRWIVIPRWEEFQHYSKRNPPWIKTYTRLLRDDAYAQLSLSQRGLLQGLWLMRAAGGEDVRESRARRELVGSESDARYFKRHLEALNHAGFILFRASSVLAPETETETEDLKQSRLQPNEPAPAAMPSDNTDFVLQPLAEHISQYLGDLEVPV